MTSRDTEIERDTRASVEVWRLGEHAPDPDSRHAPGEADCLVCGQRWPCPPYQFLMELATDGQRLRSQPASEPLLDELYKRVAAMLCAHAGDTEPHEATAEAIDANHGVTARTIVRIVRASQPADNEAAE